MTSTLVQPTGPAEAASQDATAQRMAEVLTAAVAGDRVALRQVTTATHPAVLRYCRAWLGAGDTATTVAAQVCRTVVASLGDLSRSGTSIHAFVHRHAAGAVSAAAPAGPPTGLPAEFGRLRADQREVLVLRIAVGLSAEETAAALGCSVAAVRITQHRALERLRAVG